MAVLLIHGEGQNTYSYQGIKLFFKEILMDAPRYDHGENMGLTTNYNINMICIDAFMKLNTKTRKKDIYRVK